MLRRTLLTLFLAVSVAGCSTIQSFTTQRENPITIANLDQAKIVFAEAGDFVLYYQAKCFGGTFDRVTRKWSAQTVTVTQIRADPVLNVLCKNRVTRYRAMKTAEKNSEATIITADKFIAENPSGNAVSYIRAAMKAVATFKSRTAP